MPRTTLALTLSAAVLAACSSADGPADDGNPAAAPSPTAGGEVTATYDFGNGSDGWAADMTDYTEATRPDDFLSETGASPPGLDAGGDHVHLAATNTSDDLFMYLRREVGAELPLEPAGTVANGIPCEEAQEQDLPYADVSLQHTLADPATTTEDGTVWLFVGTDSGFEGRTSLFYDRIEVTFTPTDVPAGQDE